MLNFAAICPHSPVLIPEIGGSQSKLAKKTIESTEVLAGEFAKKEPELIIIISPHGPMRYDKFTINLTENFRGNFSNFSNNSIEHVFQNDSTIAKKIFTGLRENDLPVEKIREPLLDYGSLVPLYYLTKKLGYKPKIITLTYTNFNLEMHYNCGWVIGEILKRVEKNTAFIASSNLSHRLTENAPAGFSPYGIKFDYSLLDLLKKNEVQKILEFNPDFCQEVSECGLRSIITALGTIHDLKHSYQQLSYEYPLGVGYLVSHWEISKVQR